MDILVIRLPRHTVSQDLIFLRVFLSITDQDYPQGFKSKEPVPHQHFNDLVLNNISSKCLRLRESLIFPVQFRSNENLQDQILPNPKVYLDCQQVYQSHKAVPVKTSYLNQCQYLEHLVLLIIVQEIIAIV